MQFLKTLFWFLLAVVFAVFAIGNWTAIPIRLWAGLIAEVNLPMLLVFTFLSGCLPVLLYHHAVKWRLRQKLTSAERTVADLRGAAAPVAAMSPSAPPYLDIPPASVPMAVPPGVA